MLLFNPHWNPGFNIIWTISTNTTNFNLYTFAQSRGWVPGDLLDATITVAPGIIVSATSTAGYAFSTGGTFLPGSRLSLINNGYIVGKGGTGYAGPYPGLPGGTAVQATSNITIVNNGTIGGGGGGGGGTPGGGSGGGGGAGYGLGGTGGAGTTPGGNGGLLTGGTAGVPGNGDLYPGGDGGPIGTVGHTSTDGYAGGQPGACVSGKSFINSGAGITGTTYGTQA